MGSEPLRITVLGSATPFPRPGSACSGYLAEHGGLPAFALRVEDGGGRSLVYSGDCEPCPALVELALDCHLFVCEADGSVPGHHSAAQAGRSAADARAGRLVVTRVGPGTTPAEAVALAAAEYPGDIAHADPGLRFEAGAGAGVDVGTRAGGGSGA